MSGEATVTPGYAWQDAKITKSRLNQTAQPVVRVNALSIGTRELVPADVLLIVPSVGRNVLFNGNFDLWQRGGYTVFSPPITPAVLGASASEEFGADRWSLGVPTGATKRQITRTDFTLTQTDVPGSPLYYLHWNQTAATESPILSQPIEDVRTLAGKNVVVSWWMKGGVGAGNVTCRLVQSFGGSPAQKRIITATTGGVAALTVGANWVKFTATFTIPSLAGYVISGTDHALVLQFLMPATTVFTIDFAQVQMEEGAAPTVFEKLSQVQIQSRCERYYEFHAGSLAISIANFEPSYYYVRKYRVPTITLVYVTSGTGAAFTAFNAGNLINVGYRQTTGHSTVAAFITSIDAEIYLG